MDTWDPHEPWDPPVYYARRYKPDYVGPAPEPAYGLYGSKGLTDDDLEAARAGYLGEITMVDRWVGRLLERLESLGVAEDTAVLFTTDHGFLFGEHGGIFGKMIRARPGRNVWLRSPLYEEIAHIPLLITIPGGLPRRVPSLVSGVDLMPTILDLLGVPIPEGLEIHGRSFAPLVTGAEQPGRDFVVTTMPLTNVGEQVRVVDGAIRGMDEYQPATITTAEWSMLYSARGDPVELYHLPTDPGQQHDVAPRHPEVVEALHGLYYRLLRDLGVRPEYLEPRSRRL